MARQLICQEVDRSAQEPGYEETKKLLAVEQPPDSIFCASEYILQGMYRAIQDSGLRVSLDIGVISHDNSTNCLLQQPNTSAVSFQSYEAGCRAAEILKKLCAGEQMVGFNMYVLQPELALRESCLGPGRQI